jgi:hypothetical protein
MQISATTVENIMAIPQKPKGKRNFLKETISFKGSMCLLYL